MRTPSWFALSLKTYSVITVICWAYQFQRAGRMTFCHFAKWKREIFSSSKEMQHSLKTCAAQILLFSLCSCHFLPSTALMKVPVGFIPFFIPFIGYLRYLEVTLNLFFLCHCCFFSFWWHNDSFAPRCLLCSDSLHEQWQWWAGLVLLLITIKAALLAVMSRNMHDGEDRQAMMVTGGHLLFQSQPPFLQTSGKVKGNRGKNFCKAALTIRAQCSYAAKHMGTDSEKKKKKDIISPLTFLPLWL